MVAGETSLQGALREVKEEAGITLEPEKGYLFKTFRREKFTWANVNEILELMETDEFVPLGENLYHKELFGLDTNF